MDHDKFSADDLCGHATVNVEDLYDGWSGKIDLTHPKKGIFANENTVEESAGKLYVSIRYDYEKITALTRVPKQNSWPSQELFHLRERDCWGHEEMVLGSAFFLKQLEQASNTLKYALTLRNIHVYGDEPRDGKVTVLKATKQRFMSFVRHCGREKPFIQACRVSTLEKQNHLKEMCIRLIDKWEAEDQSNLMRRGIFDFDANKVEVMDPSRFRTAYRGVKAHISIRNALNLSGGGWFDNLDPYAIVKFQGTTKELRTSVLQDAGGDPIWNCEGSLVYSGETALEVTVWDYDKYSADDKIAEGVIYHERFCGGFEGMVPLTIPGQDGNKKKKKGLKPMMIVIGIQWDPPRDPALVNTQSQSLTQAALTLATGGAGALRALGQ
jgi:hypothetical protein